MKLVAGLDIFCFMQIKMAGIITSWQLRVSNYLSGESWQKITDLDKNTWELSLWSYKERQINAGKELGLCPLCLSSQAPQLSRQSSSFVTCLRDSVTEAVTQVSRCVTEVRWWGGGWWHLMTGWQCRDILICPTWPICRTSQHCLLSFVVQVPDKQTDKLTFSHIPTSIFFHLLARMDTSKMVNLGVIVVWKILILSDPSFIKRERTSNCKLWPWLFRAI